MTTQLPRRRVGKTDIEVTILGQGGAPLGNLFEALDEEQARDTIAAAYRAGVRYFDTAPQYGHGLSEHRFGPVLRGFERDSFVLSTKVGRLLRATPRAEMGDVVWRDPLEFRIDHDYTYDGVMRSVEDSWQRLGMRRIDIAYIHDVDVMHHGEAYDDKLREALDGAVPALNELRRAGVIGAAGLGVNEVAPCLAFAENADLDCFMLAGRFTLLEPAGLDDLLPLAERDGFSIVIAGPFNSGILATGARDGAHYNYRPAQAEIAARVTELQGVCDAHDVPLGAAALQFPLSVDRVACVVTGAVKAVEIEQNVDWISHPIPQALWTDLREKGLLPENASHPV